MNKFNLSKKIFWIDGKKEPSYNSQPRLYIKDVKEFVRLLKEELSEHAVALEDTKTFKKGVVLGVHNIIDKLAGDKLIWKKKH